MPRFLPKLIQRIKAEESYSLQIPSATTRPKSRTARRIIPTALPYPSFSPHGRKRSILLDDVNPVIHHDAFTQHKRDAPIVPSTARRGKHANASREMTALECEWWSNPYLRMLASPLRRCIVTEKQIPSDFLIRLAVLDVSGPRLSRMTAAILPDGVEHPRFRRRNSGRGYYLVCNKVAIRELVDRSSYKRIPTQSKIHVHSLLGAQIGHQLRLKVLQELELLAESLRCSPQGSLEHTVLRRLTRTEWTEMKTSGQIPQPGAAAVLVVPPLNRRSVLEEASNNEKCLSSRALPPLPPLSVLHETQAVSSSDITLQSTRRVPLYNGVALFPSPLLRSKLYKALQNTLLVERRARWRQGTSARCTDSLPNDSTHQSTRDKASHAYLLSSNGNTLCRADSVPLAIALWRIRMWEGQEKATNERMENGRRQGYLRFMGK
ncbi:hypothetical protein K439DRAFT_1400616 [Ramaria rubella]|nr:hypothetical protein K439DRAFT_1400616 [Ramaria rubella]